MRRLRFFRALLLGLLLILAGALLLELNPPEPVHTKRPDGDQRDARAQGVQLEMIEGGRRSVSGTADFVSQDEQGRMSLEGVRDLEILRGDGGPLIVDARHGASEGRPGTSKWQFDEEVVLRDPDESMELRLPRLEVDEVGGVAIASGSVRFTAPGVEGTAERVIYGLQGQPTELEQPLLENLDGGRLEAESAVLHDGLRDVELRGGVTLQRAEELLEAERMRVTRDENGHPTGATGSGSVSARWPAPVGPPGRLQARDFALSWDPTGDVQWLLLDGDAVLTRGRELLSAGQIELDRRQSGDVWRLRAEPDVSIEGRFGDENGRIRADSILAEFDRSFGLRRADAEGHVIFEADATRAEARLAHFESGPGGGTIELFDEEPHKAHLARARTRVAADRIRTDPAGRDMIAQGRVESTLLPVDGGASTDVATVRLFSASEAIHFVAERLETSESGSLLIFSGSVRGWQGERNLSANLLRVDQRNNSLVAIEQVTTRIPRGFDGKSGTEAEYIQISAARLDYDDAAGQASYSGGVRLVLAEGWLGAETMVVALDPRTRRVASVEAFGSATMEFQPVDPAHGIRPMAGAADRAVYIPAEQLVRLFGEQAPATARRLGDGGETTSGKVLRYRMDLGSFEADSGEQGTAKIRTGGR